MSDGEGPKVRFMFGGPIDGLEFRKAEAEKLVEEYRLIFWSDEGEHYAWSGFAGGGLYWFCMNHKGYEFQRRTHNNFEPPDPETRNWDMPSPTEELPDGV